MNIPGDEIACKKGAESQRRVKYLGIDEKVIVAGTQDVDIFMRIRSTRV